MKCAMQVDSVNNCMDNGRHCQHQPKRHVNHEGPAMTHHPSTCARVCVLAAVAAALVVTGCSTSVPPPTADISAVHAPFRQAPVTNTEALDAATWRGFGDPVLDDLVARARAANHDVRIAAQRVRQARAGSIAASSRLWPTVAATGSVSDQRTGLPEEVKRGSPDTRAIRGAIDLGWEIDVFGAARAAADAAELDALSAEAGV